jgi:hypothetical protein
MALRGVATLAVIVAVSLIGVLGATPADAATHPALPGQGGVGCGPVVTTLSKVHSLGTTVKSPSGPTWEVSGIGPGVLTLSKSVTVDNSYSVASTISAAQVSSTVGYSVTKSFTTATSYTITVPAKQTWVLRTDAVYAVTGYNWKQTQGCDFPGGSSSKTGTGTALKFVRLQYRSYQT